MNDAADDLTMTADLPAMLANCRQYWLNFSQEVRGDGPIVTYRTGVPHPQLNGVIQVPPVSVDRISEAVFALSGVPYVWWIGADSCPAARETLIALGARQVAGVPVMAARLDALSTEPMRSHAVTIAPLAGDDDLSRWVACYCEPMGVAEADFAAMLHAERGRSDEAGQLIRFAANDDGEIVGTSELFLHAGVAGIYLVTTKKTHRGQGIGAALTHAACRAGLERGLTVATLQASSSGHPVYQSLGFRDVGSYDLLAFP